MISSKLARRIIQILPFGLISMIFGFVYALLEQGVLGDYPTYPSTGNPYYFNPVSAALLALAAGIALGLIEVVLLNKSFQKSTFLAKILGKTLIYMLLISTLTFNISIIGHAVELGVSPLNKQVVSYGLNFLSSFAFWSIMTYMSMGVSVALFYSEVSDNIGQGVLINFFTGKYHRPIEEERIFMFLDMKDSTAIAEQLGHVRYFEMLSEYYADLTDPIIDYGGEIYQYVGDEVVVTWRRERGLADNNCLSCFFAMKAALERESERYHVKYGLVPTFKAGLHMGEVTTGEIGVIKKEIIFSGDVLNTTARIQGLCNELNADLLLSEQLMKSLALESQYRSISRGAVELRGRNEKVNLYAIDAVD